MTVDPLNVGAIAIALITALGMWASHRQSAKAAMLTSRSAAEVEAYGRARKMDTETIERQDEELQDLVKQARELRLEKNRLIIESAAKDVKISALINQNQQLRDKLREKEKKDGQQDL